jgi:hypothetical protein
MSENTSQESGASSGSGTLQSLPDDWPEGFPDLGHMHCDHYYQWVDSDERYECIKCGVTREEPK